MTFDLTKIMASKREFRQRLAARPIEEKLAMLDALRARTLALRGSRAEPQPGTLREQTSGLSDTSKAGRMKAPPRRL